jgi:LysM repeat protein
METRLLLIWLSAAALLFSGCDRRGEARFHAGLAEAEKRLAAEDTEGAVRVFESLIDGTPRTVEAHYRLGHLYADRLKEPLGALYHFSRYLAIAPEGVYAKEVKAFEKEGELRLLSHLSRGAPLTQEEAARLKNENLKLRKTVEELKTIKAPPPGVAAAGGKPGEPVPKPIPAGVRTHKVTPGETFGSIAAKYYKNKGRWKDIQNANYYPTDTVPKLKLGQELYIP